MSVNDPLQQHLPGLTLNRLGDDESPAGLWVCSLPLPRDADTDWSLNNRPTHGQPLGKWYDADSPRRVLLAADGGNTAPASINVTNAPDPADGLHPCNATAEVFAHAQPSDLGSVYWEQSQLKVEWNGKWVALVMGMRCGAQVHWWEHCQLVTLSKSDSCLEIEMSGNIPYDLATSEMVKALGGRDVPYIHHHNSLNASIYARLHSNGVCEIYARHVNSAFVDDGGDLIDAVAVMGIRVEDGQAAYDRVVGDIRTIDRAIPGDSPHGEVQPGNWDGSRKAFELGPAKFDVREVARLATAEKAGHMNVEDDLLVWQPYMGVEAYGGEITARRQGDPYLCGGAEAHIIPRGMARTLRFSISLNPQRSLRVQRYLAPSWWYGMCEEFSPQALLPVSNRFDERVDQTREASREYMWQGGFDDGGTPRTYEPHPPQLRTTPSAEGDVAGLFCRIAYLTGDADDYESAMRGCYFHTDVWIDHAVHKVRYQGYNKDAWALPLARVQSCIMAWLEHGDAYCLRAAQAVIETAYWWHKSSWPRSAVGRDAYLGRGAMQLWRYLGDDHYRARAYEVIRDLHAVQWPDGSFGDQGGGAGIHGAAAYIVKPWMGWMATQVVLDYLEHFPDDTIANEVIERFVGWLMEERAPRYARGGATDPTPIATGWTYQHNFRGKQLPGVPEMSPPTQGMHLFHYDYIARLMTWVSLRTGDPTCFDAFAESHDAKAGVTISGYGSTAATFNYIPWMQARLWNATLTEDGIKVEPKHFGDRTPQTGRIMTPAGPVDMKWEDGEAKVIGDPPIKVKVQVTR